MKRRIRSRVGACRERGQALVMMALMLPVFLGLGSVVLSVGNWYVHKKHLQTLVDAGAFASAQDFVGCYDDVANANPAIRAAALQYAGDTSRDPSTRNRQLEEPNDVHVVLNSSVYWAGNPYPADDTLGTPCDTKFVDVKATDDKVPLLFRWLPATPSPKARARIEIRKVHGLNGMLPWAIPEIDPARVAVLFVDEEAPAIAPILGQRELINIDPPPAGFSEFAIWDSPQPAQMLVIGDGAVQDDRARIGVVVVVSETATLNLAGSVNSICNQDPPRVKCYAGSAPGPYEGPYFIHGYAGGGAGTASSPKLRDVRLENLTCGADNKSAPWFLSAGDCEVRFRAVVDFGVGGNPTGPPVRASVSASPGGNMSWATCSDSAEGCWTSDAITLPSAGTNQAGRQNFSISWRTNPSGGGRPPSGSFSGVAHPYVADKNSGPLEYLQVSAGANPADSVGFGPNQFSVRVGLNRPLKQTPKLDPPILLRFKSGSLSQTINCDVDNVVYYPPFKPGYDLNTMPKDAAEIANGCVTTYNINGPGPCPVEYDTTAELPPTTTNPSPTPTCAEGRPGQVSSIRQGMEYRFEQPCTPNNWPKTALEPYPPPSDPRWVILIVTDFGAFDLNNERIVKIRRFAGFYVTGWDSGPSGGGDQTGNCVGPPNNNDPHPLNLLSNRDDGDVWGHFVTFVVPSPSGNASDELCAFTELGVCIGVLVD